MQFLHVIEVHYTTTATEKEVRSIYKSFAWTLKWLRYIVVNWKNCFKRILMILNNFIYNKFMYICEVYLKMYSVEYGVR